MVLEQAITLDTMLVNANACGHEVNTLNQPGACETISTRGRAWMQGIWTRVLHMKLEDINLDDNFFQLCGDFIGLNG